MFEMNVESWEGAKCAEPWYGDKPADPNIFHDNHYKAAYEAKKVCQQCPLINKCLEFALTNEEEWGVWGGLTADERRKLRRTK